MTSTRSPTLIVEPAGPTRQAMPNSPLPSISAFRFPSRLGASLHHRCARKATAGSRCLSPESWSICGTAQRGQGSSAVKLVEPMFISCQVSSTHASPASTITFARKRSMPNGSTARSCSHLNDAELASRTGARSTNVIVWSKTSREEGARCSEAVSYTHLTLPTT